VLCCAVLSIGLQHTRLVAKIESLEGLQHHAEILEACDALILSRGNLGICLQVEQVFRAQKAVLQVIRSC
jgi:pyruvate kinase